MTSPEQPFSLRQTQRRSKSDKERIERLTAAKRRHEALLAAVESTKHNGK